MASYNHLKSRPISRRRNLKRKPTLSQLQAAQSDPAYAAKLSSNVADEAAYQAKMGQAMAARPISTAAPKPLSGPRGTSIAQYRQHQQGQQALSARRKDMASEAQNRAISARRAADHGVMAHQLPDVDAKAAQQAQQQALAASQVDLNAANAQSARDRGKADLRQSWLEPISKAATGIASSISGAYQAQQGRMADNYGHQTRMDIATLESETQKYLQDASMRVTQAPPSRTMTPAQKARVDALTTLMSTEVANAKLKDPRGGETVDAEVMARVQGYRQELDELLKGIDAPPPNEIEMDLAGVDPATVTSQDEYDQIAPGSLYVGMDGKMRVKQGGG